MLTATDLQIILPAASGANIDRFWQPLNDAMDEFSINSPARQAAFLAQIGHESGSLRYVRELGSHAYLDKYDTGSLAARLGNTPEDDDDGQKYRGRGLIQITGLDNYRQCGDALNLDLIEHPELLEQPVNAARSAGWWWAAHGCNEIADSGNFQKLTKRINGGLNGLADRKAIWKRAKEQLA